jgi:hypothetical protein
MKLIRVLSAESIVGVFLFSTASLYDGQFADSGKGGK